MGCIPGRQRHLGDVHRAHTQFVSRPLQAYATNVVRGAFAGGCSKGSVEVRYGVPGQFRKDAPVERLVKVITYISPRLRNERLAFLKSPHIGHHIDSISVHRAIRYSKRIIARARRPGGGGSDRYICHMSWWDAAYRSGVVNWDPGEYDRHLPRVIREFDIAPGRVLDLGCGTGKSAIWLAERGFDATGIDLSPAAIQQARRSAQRRGVDARFIAGRFPEEFTLPSSEPRNRDRRPGPAHERTLDVYDTVVDRASIQHMGRGGELKSIMTAVAALLRPGGLIYSLVIAGFGVPRGWGMGVWNESAIRSLFAAPFTPRHIERTVFTPGRGGLRTGLVSCGATPGYRTVGGAAEGRLYAVSPFLIVRPARLQMRTVSFASLSRSHRSHVSATQSARVFDASLSQLATESCTYFSASAFNGSRIGKPSSGYSFKRSMWAHQTPRGRVSSLAKRRT